MTRAGKTGGAVFKRWAAVKIAGHLHLVGVLVGGHTRLEAGRWVITSAVIAYDRTTMTAVTGLSGRTYHLLDRLAAPVGAAGAAAGGISCLATAGYAHRIRRAVNEVALGQAPPAWTFFLARRKPSSAPTNDEPFGGTNE